ncbi:MAG: sulfate adenylyltransferase, large subunit [Frankiales bacterium]|nr:sulfate adenylyltransferase, large subunit [Frankiales bacterium]
MDLLRIATAGSVDDGKSTLIGRLLFDSKAILADTMDAISRTSKSRGFEGFDLALLTDGLRAEREQGITIDVAYRYFATPARAFILADTPGHVQYTRNMVTGASTAELAIVLVDARNGIIEQSRRHAAIAALLRVPHVVVAVNKMDLVGFDKGVYDAIAAEFTALAADLGLPDVVTIPVSALNGDNVVDPSNNTPWYDGPTLLRHLESVPTLGAPAVGARFPVQYVIRPQTTEHPDYRGYAGKLEAGTLHVGDEVVVLPSGLTTTVSGIDTYDGPREVAVLGDSVTVLLADDVDVSRGDMIATAAQRPQVVKEFTASVCWLSDDYTLRAGERFMLKHTTRSTKAIVGEVLSRLDVQTLSHGEEATELTLNDLGRVRLKVAQPLAVDSYRDSRGTGAFILIDELSGATVGAGMVD